MRIFIILSLILLGAPVFAGNATADDALMQQATEYFTQAGKAEDPEQARELYHKAATRYQKLIAEGVHNGKLHYNLGNTYFRMNNLGKAILEYKRAQLYTPHDQKLLNNLSRALMLRKDKFKQSEQTRILKTLLFWHYDIPASVRRIIFGVFFIFFWLCLCIRLSSKGKKFSPKWLITSSAILWVCLLGSLIAQPLEIEGNRQGVITATETIARKGDGENYHPAFTQPLHSGAEFTLLQKRPEWYEVKLPDGRTCWIPSHSAQLVIPQ